MSKEEIIEGNVIIANYLGHYYDVEKHEYPDMGSFFDNATDSIYHKSTLLYNYRWDWLEDAINEITKTNNFIYDKNDINVAFKQVVEFIKLNT
jgi:hypothetical protein